MKAIPVKIRLLPIEDYPEYAGMTFPLYRQQLLMPLGASNLVAIGVEQGKQPIGLALASIEKDTAELLSIFLVKAERGKKVSVQMMNALCEELIHRGVRSLHTSYMDGVAGAQPLQALLARTGWEAPQPTMLFFHYLAEKMAHTPWMRPFRTPPHCELFRLEEMTDTDREQYQDITRRAGFPASLDYLKQPYPVSWANSYGLRRNDTLIGWMATHLLGDHTIRYTSLFVEDQYQAKGYALPLMFKAIQTHCQKLLHIPNAIQGIPFAFPAMVRLARNKLQPYAEREEVSWEVRRKIA